MVQMAKNRDDFSQRVKLEVALRAGMRCSNPGCRCPTAGPKKQPSGSVSIGVAAHIAAAAPGGPRYQQLMSRAERVSSSNAIWLCQVCAARIDRDVSAYDIAFLNGWKDLAESSAQSELGSQYPSSFDDRSIVYFMSMCLDRPAFNDLFHRERSTEEFDRALEDTITAFNTGALRSRDGVVLQTHMGKSYLKNPLLRSQIDAFVQILRAIRSRYLIARESGEITEQTRRDGRKFYMVHSAELADWFDNTRLEALRLFKKSADLVSIPFTVTTLEISIARNTSGHSH